MTLQFYSEDVLCDDLFFVNEKTSTRTFVKWCNKRKPRVQHVVYIHNLAFDLPELMWSIKQKLIGVGGEFDFTLYGWRCHGVYGSPTFVRMTRGSSRCKNDTSIMIVDSFSYFRGSLEKGAEMFCPDLPKLKRPDGLGDKQFKPRDTAFCEYAMRDAVVSYHMGKAIERMHQEYDLTQCVSVADMAARIFRHKFLSYTIPQPPRDVMEAALLSYHGGKNNLAVEPGWYEGVTTLDISSAYPDAMAQLPAFSDEALYKRIRFKSMPKQVPAYGVYKVSGKVDKCYWPSVFSSAFKPLHGDVTDIWMQGMELNEALRSGELRLSGVSGHYYDAENDIQAPALRFFVDTFYRLKESEKDPVLRFMQKLILNSISGKFIQTRKRGTTAYTDIDAEKTVQASELIAGGMFHPFIASAITAHTRARIHQLEHKYKALHTATDGIMTQDNKAKAEGRGLGALTVETQDATLLLLRNKCYVLYTRKGKKTFPSKAFKGKHIAKHALHGFQGSVYDLEKLVATNRRKYSIVRPHRLKEALKRGLTPNEFARREYNLKVGPIPLRGRAKFS